MNELQLHRHKHQAIIRKTKLTSIFETNRQVNMELSKQEAKEKINPQLEHLKSIALIEEGEQNLLKYLLNLHQIVKDYDITSFVTSKLQLAHSPRCKLLFRENYRQLTYLDLLLSLLIDNKDLSIISQCAYIIRICASQIRSNLAQKYQVQHYKHYLQVVNRLAKNYPYELLDHSDSRLVQNSILFVYEALISCTDGSTVYFLVNKLKPGILSYFIRVVTNTLLMNIEEIREEVVRAVLTAMFYINRYNYVQYQLEDYRELITLVKEMVMKEILKAQRSKNFRIYCKFMELVCENRQLKLTQQELFQLEGLMPTNIFQRNQYYFSLLAKVLDYYPHILSTDSCQLLLSTLFFIKSQLTEDDLVLKLQLMLILNKHIINTGNNFRLSDAQLFVCFWGEYSKADRLMKLIYDLQLLAEKGEKGLELLFGLIAKIFLLKEQLDHIGVGINLSELEIGILNGYELFQKALRDHQIEINEEDNDVV